MSHISLLFVGLAKKKFFDCFYPLVLLWARNKAEQGGACAFYLCFIHFKLFTYICGSSEMALGFAVRLQPSSAEYANSLAANLHLSGRLVQALSWCPPLCPTSLSSSVAISVVLPCAQASVERFHTFVCHVCTFAFTLSTRARTRIHLHTHTCDVWRVSVYVCESKWVSDGRYRAAVALRPEYAGAYSNGANALHLLARSP